MVDFVALKRIPVVKKLKRSSPEVVLGDSHPFMAVVADKLVLSPRVGEVPGWERRTELVIEGKVWEEAGGLVGGGSGIYLRAIIAYTWALKLLP
jgi:hypothetical protein